MICEQCKQKQASVHLTKIINNQKDVINLCEDCAGNYDTFSAFEGNFSIHKLLTKLIQYNKGAQLVNYPESQVSCEHCNTGYNEFGQSGQLGCSHCYDQFGDSIKPLLQKIHGNQQHQGKAPKRTGQAYRMQRDVERLRVELQQLVTKEEFEQAAIVRDKIKELEQQLS